MRRTLPKFQWYCRFAVFANHFMPVLAYNGGCACKAGTAAQRIWIFDSLVRLTGFPPMVRKKLGFALYQAQIGPRHESAKMLHGFAEAVWQVRADDPGGTYRAVYVAQLGEEVYVLDAFQKKATSGIATSRRELDLIRQRLQLARKLAGK
jgi:phage-related protein